METMETKDPNKEAAATLGSPEPEANISSLALYFRTPPDMPDREEYLFFLTASIVFLLGMLAFLGYIYLDPVRKQLYQMVLDKERIRAVIDSAGFLGPILYIVIQALEVVFMVSFVPLEVAGGFLFGLPLGVLYSTLGASLGSLLAFLLARWLGTKYVTRFMHPDTLKSYRKTMRRGGALTAFLILLIPGIPKDFVYYLLGLTRMSVLFFLMVVTLARFPSTLLMTLQGTQVFEGNYLLTLGSVVLYLGLAILIYRHREIFYQWLSRWHLEED
jgi:uncharacterized membrane protein YdjX (TVP38/TMEM64 family)